MRTALLLTALPFALWKAAPRVKKLRFNLEEFAKSDFFKIFDFWKLLESALNGGQLAAPGADSNPNMPRMTVEREAALPRADPGEFSCFSPHFCCPPQDLVSSLPLSLWWFLDSFVRSFTAILDCVCDCYCSVGEPQ